MYLIKVDLSQRVAHAKHLLDNCQEMHRFVTCLLGADRQASGLLYRTNFVRDRLHIYIYAQQPIANPQDYDVIERDVTAWLESLKTGQQVSFDLIASPSKKVVTENGRNSKRRVLREASERQIWLERKARQHGFVFMQVTEMERIHTKGMHHAKKGGEMHHDAFHYQGVLQITDEKAFRNAIQKGIGPGKAYGFGMMLVKPL